MKRGGTKRLMMRDIGKKIKQRYKMELEKLQILAQLVDNTEILIDRLKKSYDKNDGEEFTKSKNAILDFQKKIDQVLR